MPLVYVLVLFGSLFVIVAILGLRLALRTRGVRKFVRSVRTRIDEAEARGACLVEETVIEKPRKNPRTSAIEMQQVRSLTRSAEKELARGETDAAERLFIQALTINADAHDVRAQLARLYLDTERDHKAEAMYRELLLRHEDVSSMANLGLALYRQGKYEEAHESYARALEKEPKNPERVASLGRACVPLQRFPEACALLEKAVQFFGRDTDLMQLLAECYLKVGKTKSAQDMYERINKLEPYNEEIKARLGELARV